MSEASETQPNLLDGSIRHIKGTVQGAAARKYLSYCYLKPRHVPITLRDLDPDRMYLMREYPRWSSRPCNTAPKCTELADYVIKVIQNGRDTLVQFIMMPNKYCLAKWHVTVFEMQVSGFFFMGESEHFALLDAVFGNKAERLRAFGHSMKLEKAKS